MKNYDPKKIEKKWQKEWARSKIYETKDKVKGKKNLYTLFEFPYPSGNLHIGHWYAFAIPDIFARTKRMQGNNVMFPIGFDAFGLPAENAAIKRELNPKKWTYQNIAYMEKQLQSMGASFDWSRKVITADESYYKWTQWLFLQFYKKGLAYKNKASVNWCPNDQTVLANEQVINGKCDRCGTEVIQKDLEQWFFKITDYGEELLNDLDKLNWPEAIKDSQRNWIGRSEGAEIEFGIVDSRKQIVERVKVFTTRADTLFGATYLVLAPEHPLVKKLIDENKIENKDEILRLIEVFGAKTEIERTDTTKEKNGAELKGIKAINPATGEEIPVWTADYVLGNYGTGAVMGVPAHDERDKQFVEKYNLPIVEIELADTQEIISKFGKKVVKYKLRDWLLSRQRYWGCPIPVVYDPEGNPHPVPEKHLPWKLPTDKIDFTPKGVSPLASSKELKKRVEKIFGKGWTPEYDTMDTFVDSSWYFLRYCDPKNKKVFADKKKLKNWMPVERYSGGAEHTTMHLLYSRFFHKALCDMGLVNESEPYLNRMNRGIILGPDGQKMSKSKGNVIDPDEQVGKFGADTVRMYLAFIGPYNEVGHYPWDIGGIIGTRRFLEKVWRLSGKVTGNRDKHGNISMENRLNTLIRKVSEDSEKFKFNTAISAMMILVNEMEKTVATSGGLVARKDYEILLKLLAPFAPHMTEEIWHNLGNKKSIHLEKWPEFDPKKIVEVEARIAVQINGKVRGVVMVKAEAEEAEVQELALGDENIKKWIAGKEVKKVIFVPGKVLNLVI